MATKKNTTVDAVSVEDAGSAVAQPQNPTTTGAKVDTSGLSKMLNTILADKMAKTATGQNQTQPVNPATLIAGTSRRLEELYSSFDQIKKIAQRITGKNVTDQLPNTLRLDRVDVHFYACDDAGNPPKDSAGEILPPECATLRNIASVGDLGNLITTEMGVIIYAIQQEIAALLDVANLTKETTDKARASWDEANKDRKIEIRAVGETDAPPAAVTSVQAADNNDENKV